MMFESVSRFCHYGSDTEGFSVDWSGDSVVVVARGFWGAELASQLGPAVMEALRRRGGRPALVLDVAELRTLRDEGQSAFKSLIIEALSGLARTIRIRGASALTKLQMMRIARETGKCERVQLD